MKKGNEFLKSVFLYLYKDEISVYKSCFLQLQQYCRWHKVINFNVCKYLDHIYWLLEHSKR